MRNLSSVFNRATVESPAIQTQVARFVSRTYGWMSVGLLLTGFVSLWVVQSEAALQTIFGNRAVFYVLMAAELGLVFGLSAIAPRLTFGQALGGFLAYAALNGLTLSVVLLVYTATSVGQVFLITAAMFGGLALFGTLTKKDLTAMGAFVGMGLWGMILVGIANLFIRSESLSLGMSLAGVLIFAGLTAYDSQRIKAMAVQYAYARGSSGTQEGDKGAIFAALTLYLNFINLFLNLLRLLGSRRD